MSGITLWGGRNNHDIFDAMDVWADRIFGAPPAMNSVGPKTNVKKTEEGIEVSLSVPGVNKEDININVNNNLMTVSYKSPDGEDKSFATNSFRKSWTLPENTDPEFITAKSENGILKLSVPTGQTTTSRTVTVQ